MLFKPSDASMRLTAIAQNIEPMHRRRRKRSGHLEPLHGELDPVAVHQGFGRHQISRLQRHCWTTTSASRPHLVDQLQQAEPDSPSGPDVHLLGIVHFSLAPSRHLPHQRNHPRVRTPTTRGSPRRFAWRRTERPFEWMVGGYYTHEEGLIDQDSLGPPGHRR